MSEAPKADKRFGQNFLHDPLVLDRIVRAIAPNASDHIVEIGPGMGALTAPLLASGARVDAIELDARLLPALEKRFETAGNLRLHVADALKTDFSALRNDGQPLRLVGNLPYNISTPLLFHVLRHADAVRDMHFMLQKEVVERMCAGPGSKTYGRLSVAVAVLAEVRSLFDVGPGAFRPVPKVTSSIVRMRPRAMEPALHDTATLDRLLRAGFAQRRKTLSNALSGVCNADAMREMDIDPRARAETIAPAQWVRLSNRLSAG